MLRVDSLCLSAGSYFTAVFWEQDPIIQLASIQFTLWVATFSEVGVEPSAFNDGFTALAACWHNSRAGRGEVLVAYGECIARNQVTFEKV